MHRIASLDLGLFYVIDRHLSFAEKPTASLPSVTHGVSVTWVASSPVHKTSVISHFKTASGHSSVQCVVSRACERSRKQSRASQKSGRVERSMVSGRGRKQWSAQWVVS